MKVLAIATAVVALIVALPLVVVWLVIALERQLSEGKEPE